MSSSVDERESIWSVSRGDLRLYSRLFPSFWLAGIVYYAIYMAEWDKGWETAGGQMIIAIGAVGLSAAVLSLMALAGRSLTMVLFDWGTRNREKLRTEARAEERQALADKLKTMTDQERLAEVQRLIDEGHDDRRDRT